MPERPCFMTLSGHLAEVPDVVHLLALGPCLSTASSKKVFSKLQNPDWLPSYALYGWQNFQPPGREGFHSDVKKLEPDHCSQVLEQQ